MLQVRVTERVIVCKISPSIFCRAVAFAVAEFLLLAAEELLMYQDFAGAVAVTLELVHLAEDPLKVKVP
ncbi:MAG: hypothetical protein ACLTBR_09100 [Anaerostipes sp.]|uniref:hypothetical protein n=1 Tax=Anaerostipes sp. TaxID=1872530 RepID=UPI003992F2FC